MSGNKIIGLITLVLCVAFLAVVGALKLGWQGGYDQGVLAGRKEARIEAIRYEALRDQAIRRPCIQQRIFRPAPRDFGNPYSQMAPLRPMNR